jgi:hypothetical protein
MKNFEGMNGFEKKICIATFFFNERIEFPSADHSGLAV